MAHSLIATNFIEMLCGEVQTRMLWLSLLGEVPPEHAEKIAAKMIVLNLEWA